MKRLQPLQAGFEKGRQSRLSSAAVPHVQSVTRAVPLSCVLVQRCFQDGVTRLHTLQVADAVMLVGLCLQSVVTLCHLLLQSLMAAPVLDQR